MTATTSTQATLDKLAATRRAEADAKHAQYPQYAGHWDGWRIVEITRQLTTKLGTAFEKGDLVLCKPETRDEKVPPRGRGHSVYDQWPTRTFATCYSFRNGVDTSVRAEHVREITVVEPTHSH